MTRYVAFLRGINVGGHNKIKMAELRESLKQLGLQKIKTYIQSGNVLFESNLSEETLQEKIQAKIKADFAISSIVVIRTAKELQQIIEQMPFSDQEISEATASAKGECLHVAMMPEAPSRSNVEKLLSYTNEKERCVIVGRDVFLLFYDSIRNSKLSGQLKVLEIPVTVRNSKTLNKLATLVDELQ
jgi:uncharacterized protein (DUF1697 family)